MREFDLPAPIADEVIARIRHDSEIADVIASTQSAEVMDKLVAIEDSDFRATAQDSLAEKQTKAFQELIQADPTPYERIAEQEIAIRTALRRVNEVLEVKRTYDSFIDQNAQLAIDLAPDREDAIKAKAQLKKAEYTTPEMEAARIAQLEAETQLAATEAIYFTEDERGLSWQIPQLVDRSVLQQASEEQEKPTGVVVEPGTIAVEGVAKAAPEKRKLDKEVGFKYAEYFSKNRGKMTGIKDLLEAIHGSSIDPATAAKLRKRIAVSLNPDQVGGQALRRRLAKKGLILQRGILIKQGQSRTNFVYRSWGREEYYPEIHDLEVRLNDSEHVQWEHLEINELTAAQSPPKASKSLEEIETYNSEAGRQAAGSRYEHMASIYRDFRSRIVKYASNHIGEILFPYGIATELLDPSDVQKLKKQANARGEGESDYVSRRVGRYFNAGSIAETEKELGKLGLVVQIGNWHKKEPGRPHAPYRIYRFVPKDKLSLALFQDEVLDGFRITWQITEDQKSLLENQASEAASSVDLHPRETTTQSSPASKPEVEVKWSQRLMADTAKVMVSLESQGILHWTSHAQERPKVKFDKLEINGSGHIPVKELYKELLATGIEVPKIDYLRVADIVLLKLVRPYDALWRHPDPKVREIALAIVNRTMRDYYRDRDQASTSHGRRRRS